MADAHAAAAITEDVINRGISKTELLIPAPYDTPALPPSVSEAPLTSTLSPLSQEASTFLIKKRLISPATLVLKAVKITNKDVTDNIFKEDKYYCIKLWLPLKNDIYDTLDTNKNNRYTLEGLEFNQNFASGVYIGVAPVLVPFELNKQHIELGPMLTSPIRNLRPNQTYALIMHYLEQNQRLDNQLKYSSFGDEKDMAFLALEVARMHKKLTDAPSEYKNYAKLLEKWDLNKKHLVSALHQLSPLIEDAKDAEDAEDTEKKSLQNNISIMDQALKEYKELFAARCQHVKRCHGDLKANNLWLLPCETEVQETSKQLNALDCIDFNPLLSYIDPLSDVAMLAMDLEEQLSFKSALRQEGAKRLAEIFLQEYITHVEEEIHNVAPVMEFYLAEKAIVCTYVSILSDRLSVQGLRYWQIAQNHIHKLANLMKNRETYSNQGNRISIERQEQCEHTNCSSNSILEDANLTIIVGSNLSR